MTSTDGKHPNVPDDDHAPMVRIKKARYNLPKDVWVSGRSDAHGPSVKVATKENSRFRPDDSISISIGSVPSVVAGDVTALSADELTVLGAWIAANAKALLKHCSDNEYDTIDLSADLKPVATGME